MAYNAVRDDIFSILQAFASPRQGPQDNTALIAQAQTQPKPPEPGPLPFQPPTPTSSKVVPQADLPAPGAKPAQAGGGGAEGGFNIPPGPTPPPSQTGFAGGRAAPPSAPPPDARADAGGGGLDVFKIWQEQQDKATKAAAIERLASGGQMMLGGMTSSPSTREMLFQAAGSGGGRGAGAGGGLSGGMGFDNLVKLQEAGVAQAQRASLLKQLPTIAKQTGTSIERLRLLADTDPKKLGEYVSEVSKPDTKQETRADGSVWSWDTKDEAGTKRMVMGPDPGKVAEEGRKVVAGREATEKAEREKGEYGVLQGRRVALKQLATDQPELGLNPAALDAMSDNDASALLGKLQDPNLPLEQRKVAVSEANAQISAAAEGRLQTAAPGALEATRLGNLKTQGEIDVQKQITKDRAIADDGLDAVVRETGVSKDILAPLSPKDRADYLNARPAELKMIDRINRDRIKAGVKTLHTAESYQQSRDEAAILKEKYTAGFAPVAAGIVKQNAEHDASNRTLQKGFAARQAARGSLLSNKGIIAGSDVAPLVEKGRKLISAVTGNPDPKVENNTAFVAGTAGEVLANVSQLGAGTGISDMDREYAKQASGGDIKQPQEGIRRIMAINDLLGRRMMQENNERIAANNDAMPGFPVTTKVTELPKLTPEQKRYINNTELKNLISNPDQIPVYEEMYGGQSAAQTLANPDELILSKMKTFNENNKVFDKTDTAMFDFLKGKDAAWLEANRDTIDAKLATNYGYTGEGLLDVMIAFKQNGRW